MTTKHDPGIFHDVSADEYLEWSTQRPSELRFFALPATWRPVPQSEAMRLGAAIDAMWFDGDEDQQ